MGSSSLTRDQTLASFLGVLATGPPEKFCPILFFFFFFESFYYLFLALPSHGCCVDFSLVAANRGYCDAQASHCGGFPCCGAQAIVVVAHGVSSWDSCRARAQQLQHMGLVALQHVGSS